MPRMSRAVRVVGEKLPHGWSDLFKQICLFCSPTSFMRPRGASPTAATRRPSSTAARSSTSRPRPARCSSPTCRRWSCVPLADRLRQPDLPEQPLRDLHNFLIWLYLFRNECLLLRPQHGHGRDGLPRSATSSTRPRRRACTPSSASSTRSPPTPTSTTTRLWQLFINPYAAVPSMHCAFALMIGVPASCSRAPCSRLWALYPLLVFWVVVVTGNHYWLDGAIGDRRGGLRPGRGRLLAQARPEVWSFRARPERSPGLGLR